MITPVETTHPNSIRRVAFASCIGATIEWYDFFLYGVVTPLVFNKLFFPNFDPLVGTLLAYGTFFVGFVSRPIGGIIFGHYGDRIGRKAVLVLTLLIMGVATFLIGILPTYQSVGVWAPVLLLVLRVLQGLGIGGEWGGAVLMAVEHSPEGRRGFYGSWPQIGVPAGLLLSSGIVALLSMMPDQAFLDWGWRIAFLFSAILVAVGLYIRLTILETPAFAQIKEAGSEAKVPFLELLRGHRRNILLGLGARFIEGVTFNTFGVFSIAYVTTVLGLPRQTALTAVILASAIMIAMLPVCGMLSDRFGRRLVFGGGAILIALLVVPAFAVMNTRETGLIWLMVALLLGVIYPLIYGPQAALFSELFDTRVRYTGISFVYQFSGIFASGLTPLVATELLRIGEKAPWYLAAYIVMVALISAACVALMPETHRRDMSVDEATDSAAGLVRGARSI
jgi:metabolite-proton symporter